MQFIVLTSVCHFLAISINNNHNSVDKGQKRSLIKFQTRKMTDFYFGEQIEVVLNLCLQHKKQVHSYIESVRTNRLWPQGHINMRT